MDAATWQGIAWVITALGSAIAAVISAINFRRGLTRDAKLDVIADRVDGVTEMIAAGAHREGVIEGADAERANPTPPK